MKLIKPKRLNAGDHTESVKEPVLEDISFNIHKFTAKPKPQDKNDIMIVSCFSEFGCETVAVNYCIPKLKSQCEGKYVIVMGWYGRAYFYRHLADEFWELKEDFQWLREYCRAFHHESVNLKRIEKKAGDCGHVVGSNWLSSYAIGSFCRACHHRWPCSEKCDKCIKCGSPHVDPSLFGNITHHKPRVVCLPKPAEYRLAEARKYLGENPVGVFARGRKCYGRNLQPEFYVKLVKLLRDMGYTPVWLGEKATTQACPVDDVVDFSRMPESRDLELTLAMICQLKFTIQFWTASTRLAGMMGVPYLLFESPDQIWGQGQEGFRRALCDMGPSKLVAAHFKNVYENNDEGIDVVKRAITEMEQQNYSEMFALLETEEIGRAMRDWGKARVTG
jgi:hypothetical protein